jgi:hypothetical protein
MIFSFGYSQDLLLGFEAGESGGVNGAPFGDGPAPIVEAGTGTNTTQVLKIVGNPAGQPWQGISLNLTTAVNLTATQTMTMDVFSDTPATFLVKVKGGLTGPAIVAASATHTGGSTWQTVSFTFNTALDGQAALATGVYTGFVIHTYWAPGATTFFNPTVPTPARTLYVDNIKGPSGVPPVIAAPTTAAPTPTIDAANVISMFSNAYTNVAVDTWKTDWSNATVTLEDIQIQGNDTKKYSALDFVGIETVGANSIDASEMTIFHLDMWSPNVTTFRVKLVDFGANNAFGGGDDSEHEIVITNPALGEWVSLAIPLSDFTGLVAREHISQLILSCLPTAQGTVFVDNVYFSNGIFSNGSFERVNVSLYPNPTQGTLFLSATSEVTAYEIYNITGQRIMSGNVNASQIEINTSNLQSGIYLIKTEVNGQVNTQKFVKN